MRRFPLVCLTIVSLLLPIRAAAAAVPDARVRGGLVGGSGPAAVASAVGDVTGDGLPDLIVARGADPGPDAHTIAVFAGPLTGTLPSEPTFTVTPTMASEHYELAVGDLDDDGSGDLAAAAIDGSPAPEIEAFIQAGGRLPSAPSFTLSSAIQILGMTVSDMNGDGRDDVLFTRENSTPIEVRVRTQKADGSFASGVILVADAPVTGMSVGDANHDGLNDFALDGTMTGSVPVFFQDPTDHTFTEKDVALPDGVGVTGAVLADVNNDAYDDVVLIADGNQLAWALANGSGGFGSLSTPMSASAVSAKEVADLNDDGRIDLATVGEDGMLRIYLQQGSGGLGEACSFPTGTSTPGDDAATATGDLTSDGAADIVDADVGGTSGGALLFRQLTGTQLLSTGVDAVASEDSVQVGQSVTISGTFHDPEGGCLREDSVSLSRTGPDGTVDLGSTPFAGDGSFSFQDSPASAGSYSYQVSFAGDATHEPSASAVLPVQVAKVPTSLALHISDGTITYGQSVTLDASLDGGTSASYVVFERKGADGAWHAIDVAQTGDDGVATLTLRPSVETRYRARFFATATRFASTSGTVDVQVRADMIGRLVGKSTHDGRFTVYRCCTAYFYVKVKPSKPRDTWTATVQYYGNGRWRALGSGRYALERDGDAAIFVNAVAGYRYRIRGRWGGDAQNLSAVTAWHYFRYR
jgi:Big-like domain-containing protein/VCBS repeat protein